MRWTISQCEGAIVVAFTNASIAKSLFYRLSRHSSANVSFSADLKLLTSRAVYVDTVDGLAGHYQLVTPPPGIRSLAHSHTVAPGLQPLRTASAYRTEEATREAIWRTLLLDRLYEFETGPVPDYAASLLACACVEAEAGRGDRWFTNLWAATRNFQIAGKSLRDWMWGIEDIATVREAAQRALESHLQRTRGSYPRERLEVPVVISCVHKYIDMQRHLFVTDDGYVGAAPLGTERGDQVWVLSGCNIPFLLRKITGGHYRVVGECYIHGCMYGEIMQDLEMSGGRSEETVVLE